MITFKWWAGHGLRYKLYTYLYVTKLFNKLYTYNSVRGAGGASGDKKLAI